MRRLILRAHVSAAATLILLLVEVLPLRCLLRVLTPPRWFKPYRRMAADEIIASVRRRLARPRRMKRRACLREGLVLFHFLSLAGQEPMIDFAVFPPERAPRPMHADWWVTLNGRECSAPPTRPSAEMLRYSRARGARVTGSISP